MTLAQPCIVITCILPILRAGIASDGLFRVPLPQRGLDNHDPRAALARQSGNRAWGIGTTLEFTGFF